METTTTEKSESWGTRPISVTEADAMAAALALSPSDRTAVAKTLYEFQPDGMVRGMFFGALRAALVKAIGENEALGIQRTQKIGERFIPFSLYPHRDLYRLWFAAIPQTHPGKPVKYGVERIAESYFPVFLSSAAGRTMAVLIGTDPETILKRLREAYNVSVPHNEHTLMLLGSGRARWDAIVEPSPFYAEAFIGIMRGAMEERGVPMPKVTWSRVGAHGKHHQRIVFDLDMT